MTGPIALTKHLSLPGACFLTRRPGAILITGIFTMIQLLLASTLLLGQTINDSTPLHSAARNGNTAEAERLIRGEAAINARDSEGDTPLIIAAERGKIEVVRLLLEHKADINAKNRECRTALIAAASRGRNDIVALLLDRKAATGIRCALPQTRYSNTALTEALESRHPDTAKLLIERGADVNLGGSNDLPPIILAAGNGYAGIVRLLLEKKADVNRVPRGERSALMNAVEGDRVEIVRLLVAASAKVNFFDQTNTSILSRAVEKKNAEVTRLLLDRGADPNAPSGDKVTKSYVLISAVSSGEKDIVKLLIDKGAKVNVKDGMGNTPLSRAQEFPEIAAMLRAAGAK